MNNDVNIGETLMNKAFEIVGGGANPLIVSLSSYAAMQLS